MDTFVCTPPGVVAEWSSHFTAAAKGPLTALADVEACSTSLTGEAATQCASFTTWTQYTASFCGVLGTAANLVARSVPDQKTARDIVAGLHAIYAAVQGVNLQFLTAISSINAGKPYAPIPAPEPIPPFPEPTKGKEIGQAVESAWQTLKPFLEQMIAKMPSGSPWVKVLEGVIASSDQVLDQLKKLFDDIANR